jgi:hypothetical protein
MFSLCEFLHGTAHLQLVISMQFPDKSFLNLHEVGAVIDRSSRTVLRLIHDRQLKAHQLRGRWVVTPENLERFLKKLPSNF